MALGSVDGGTTTNASRRARRYRAIALAMCAGVVAASLSSASAGAGADPVGDPLTGAPVTESGDGPDAASTSGAEGAAPEGRGSSFAPSTRLAAWQLYQDLYVTNVDAQLPVTTNPASCSSPGTTLTFRQGVLDRINYFRAMAGVPDDITLNADFNALAQRVSLMMAANQSISHTPPSSWACYTPQGGAAANKSNLWLSRYGAAAITGWIEDPGNGNEAAGHRRWVLHPPTRSMGIGSIRGPANQPFRTSAALYVMDGHIFDPVPRPRDGFVAWPPPGFVPDDLIFDRFSFGIDGANFANASVVVTRNGSQVTDIEHTPANGYGINTLVWEVPAANTQPATYHVTIRGVSGAPRSVYEYDINAFDVTVPPEPVTIVTPANEAEYARGRSVLADYSCQMPNQVSCVGTVADGAAIDTSTLGERSFIVTATDSAGAQERRTHRYTVVDKTKPSVTVNTPPTGASYVQGQAVTADYGCADESGGSGLVSCTGTVADGAPLNTSVLGTRPFSVTGTDGAGNTNTADRGFTVTQRPDAAIAPDATATPSGTDVYSSTNTPAQTSSVAVAKGGTHTFFVSVTNDGGAPASFRLKGSTTTGAGYTVRYVAGTTNITSAVNAGTYSTGSLQPGESVTVKIKVTRSATGARPGTIKVDLGARNGAGPFVRDLVRAKVSPA